MPTPRSPHQRRKRRHRSPLPRRRRKTTRIKPSADLGPCRPSRSLGSRTHRRRRRTRRSTKNRWSATGTVTAGNGPGAKTAKAESSEGQRPIVDRRGTDRAAPRTVNVPVADRRQAGHGGESLREACTPAPDASPPATPAEPPPEVRFASKSGILLGYDSARDDWFVLRTPGAHAARLPATIPTR